MAFAGVEQQLIWKELIRIILASRLFESAYAAKTVLGYNPVPAESAEGSASPSGEGTKEMTRTMECSAVLWAIFALAGCTAATTRFPSCRPMPTDKEVRSFAVHDPFPDEDAGPKTYNRPRDFLEPRTNSAKYYYEGKQKAAYGFPKKMYGWNPSLPVSTNQYPFQPIWQVPPSTGPVAASPFWQYQ